ncbi:arylsulfatase, partial [Rhizobiaceae sp. 2RAB30]
PIAAVPAEAAPLTQDVSHRIEIEVEAAEGDAGALVAFGSSAGGYVLFVKDGKLVYAYNRCSEVTRLVSDRAVGTGRVSLGFEFRKTGILKGIGRLTIDGQTAGEQSFDATLQRISLSPMLIGRSGMPPVVDDYADAFAFSGNITRVTFEIGDDRDLPVPPPDID